MIINQLNGTIPTEFGTLERLQRLYVVLDHVRIVLVYVFSPFVTTHTSGYFMAIS